MPRVSHYQVEMSQEKALIVGDNPAFNNPLIARFQSFGIEATVVSPSAHQTISNLLSEDFDYCLVFGSDIPHIPTGIRTFIFLPFSSKSGVGHFPAQSHICYYHDFLGAGVSASPLLESFLSECLRVKSLTIPGDGLQEYHLGTLEDLIEGFIKFVFSTNPPKELILINPEGISLLSLAYRLRSLLPYKIDILFDEGKDWQEPVLDWEQIDRGQSKIGWNPASSFEKHLPRFIDNFFANSSNVPFVEPVSKPAERPTPKAVSREPIPKPPSRPRLTPLKTPKVEVPVFVPIESPSPLKKRISKLHKLKLPPVPKPTLPAPARIAVSSLVLAFSLYLFSLLAAFTITALTVRNLATSGESNLLSGRAAKTALPPAVYLQANVTALSSIPGLNKISSLREVNSLLTSYILGLKTLTSVEKLGETSKSIAQYILSDSDLDLASSLSNARLDVDGVYNDISLLDGSLPVTPPSIIPEKYVSGYEQIKAKLQEGRHATLTAKSLLAAAPDLLGVGSRRKYALLFQNNMELRPTGGFIGSFGIVSLENGKLYDMQVYDVYSADGQLKGHVEPPEEIKKILGEANWYMRDSNWDPDFPTSARRVEWFLNKTLSQEVQGTIALNVNTLQEVLHALGPLPITDYNETVTADNIFERAEYHAEVGFFPGSTQKKEFIGSVANSIITQFHTLDSNKSLSLAKALMKSIDEKNTLFAMSDSASNDVLSTLGWNGELRNLPCPDFGSSCLADYAMLVDSNFGINKANYFLKRELSLDTTISASRTIDHVLHVNYTNTSTSSAWPSGTYKNYSRLYVPTGSTVAYVKVGEKTLSNDEIKTSVEHGRLVIGFLVQVPINSSQPVEVGYTLGESLAQTSPTYSFYWQKQSGTQSDPFTVNVNYPLFMNPDIVSPQGTLGKQQLQFNLSNITDRRITIKFK